MRRPAVILPMGTVNLKTGDNQYFNIYNEWNNDGEGFGAQFWKDPNTQMPFKLIFGHAPENEYQKGDRQEFIHDQTRVRLGNWIYLQFATLDQLKEAAKEMKSGKVSAYVYK